MGGEPVGTGSFEDYYDLLGVERSASRAAIMRAYREHVKRYHPDVAERRDAPTPDPAATATLFKHLSRARTVLSNPTRRAEYDRLGHDAYLARHADGSPVQPAADPTRDSRTEETGHRAGPAWYRAENRTAPGGEPLTATDSEPTAAGSVVEGDAATTIEDLLGEDPVETAWRRFRQIWIVRTALLAPVLVALLSLLPTGQAVLVGLAWTLLIVGVSGGYARSRLPRADTPVSPPSSASVGALRPKTLRRLRRYSLVGVALGALLVAWGDAGSPWIRAGTLGAPALVDPLNTTLTWTLLCCLLAGSVLATVAVSGVGWFAHHGGYSGGYPVVRDLLATLGVASVWFGVATTPGAWSPTPLVGSEQSLRVSLSTGSPLLLGSLVALVALLLISGRALSAE